MCVQALGRHPAISACRNIRGLGRGPIGLEAAGRGWGHWRGGGCLGRGQRDGRQGCGLGMSGAGWAVVRAGEHCVGCVC